MSCNSNHSESQKISLKNSEQKLRKSISESILTFSYTDRKSHNGSESLLISIILLHLWGSVLLTSLSACIIWLVLVRFPGPLLPPSHMVGVPQGSVLGHFLFSRYTVCVLHLSQIKQLPLLYRRHSTLHHSFFPPL